ncbi:MAG: hypothetical protein AVDCRST_MAG86-4362 [uncultured Truepera sp.]|uniref:Uncharacterized protein n=1 Tax=uncultured Truepera sp. TaxID=543023 RepID=A0A6J4VU78_9DEIN|nr:MAG: hypothetical protein AVDCRST_MAG86-4362 [uncultured Truepera sp.]
MTREQRTTAIVASILFALVVPGFLIGAPLYRVWSQEQRGRADLAEARYNRQVIVEEAQARLEAARLEAQSNRELIASLGDDPERLIRFRLVDTLERAQTVYIPTEASLPILEANRLGRIE